MNIFNVRVYGLVINENRQILLCTEKYQQLEFTKFPGGGLEFGEGLVDCLKREFLEETGFNVEVGAHYYTTDFFQASVFNPKHQLISVYYLVNPQGFTIPGHTEGNPAFYWRQLDELKTDDVTFPIDKLVVGKLISAYKVMDK